MTISLGELLSLAQDAIDSGVDPSAQVLVAQQPSYPLEGALLGLVIDGDEVRLVSADATAYSRRDLWERV